MTTVRVGDALLHCVRAGPEPGSSAAAPVLLVHGYLGSVADWDAVLPGLAADRPVIAYDHRGHGASSAFGDAAAYTLDALTADLEAVVDDQGIERVDVVGHSMGGVLAMRLALARPDAVRSLVLMDTAADPTAPMLTSAVLAASSVLVRRHGMVPVAGLVGWLPGSSGRGVGNLLRQRQLAAMAGVDPVAFTALGRAMTRHPSLRGELARITCPTTVMVGARDHLLRRPARVLAAGIPGARLVVVAGAGHTPQIEQPDRWLLTVRNHLAR
ncbi:alpha/beta fold hydrolase [Pseudonocardia sp. TRM90224]|uniref:alpha/beta fold hydrolase n=1 Tax=Pseudonocardia sp. TRM90224 TaxID=2812678 RepID=UPI001E49D266|nr:alpha/beta fold hydrolase [Pseudonocardia sp. TRM90224]